MEDFKMDLRSYKESLIAGGHEPEEIDAMIQEMEAAAVGTIKANNWKKIGPDEFIIYAM